MNQIRSRLKAAYERIEFEATDTWNNNFSPYQKANQELFVREKKVQDALTEELVRPRTVRDSIPNSRLAQYSNYEYNESRERSYASSASNIYLYYPCIQNRSSVKECWMLPEVEQLFISFTYTPQFNILEISQMEETNHIDEDGLDFQLSSFLLWPDFHKVSPTFQETLERTPGKSRFKECVPVEPSDILKFEPRQFKIDTFEDMVIRMKIRSEKIKYLWSKHMRSKIENSKIETFNLIETPLRNCFIVKDDYLTDIEKEEELRDKSLIVTDFQFRKYDCNQLQLLMKSIQSLENLLLTTTKNIHPSIHQIQKPKKLAKETKIVTKTMETSSPPTRRLYSAVLQGVKKDLNKDVAANLISPVLNTSSSSSLSTPSSTFGVLTPPYQSTPVLQKFCSNGLGSPQVTPSCSWETFELKTKDKTEGNVRPIKKVAVLPTPDNNYWFNKTKNVYPSSSNKNLGSNISEATTSQGNSHNTGGGTNNVYFSNMYGSNTFFKNSYYNSQFLTNSFANNSYQSNQPVNYRNVCYMASPQVQVSIPNSVWCVQNNKPTTNYNTNHYQTQPYIFVSPQPRQMQQYASPTQTRCVRTPMPVSLPSNHYLVHSYNTTPFQQYGFPSDERTNSTHTVCSSSSVNCPENRCSFVIPMKPKESNTNSDVNFQQHNNNQTGSWFHDRPGSSKFCSIDHLKQRYSAPVLEYQSVKEGKRDSSGVIFKNSLPVSKSNSQESYKLSRRRTISEELEIHAVVQYQVSGDDLEKQAEEQYFSENWMSPPHEFIFSGGSLIICQALFMLFKLNVLFNNLICVIAY